ncbi:metal-dependent transcriptional regulator [Clostridioides difficile]
MINSTKNLLTPSMEDYLEMIYRCTLKNTYTRLNQIAQMLNVKDSSASKMMQKLGNLSLIKYQKYGLIVLTEKGREIGSFLYKRHNIIETFLKNLSQKNDVLIETELIEHVISIETVENLRVLNEFLDKNPDILQKYLDFKSN